MAGRRLTRRQVERIRQSQEQRRQHGARTTAHRAERLDEQGLAPPRPGVIIANYGPAVVVEDPEGGLHRCTVRQNLEALACGDRVVWQGCGRAEGVVVATEKRSSLLARPDYSGRLKPVAANLDQVAVVIAPRPEPNEFLIDRYLVAIARIGVEALLIVNKTDLLSARAREGMEQRLATYRRIGYTVLFVSADRNPSLPALRARLKGCTSILVGQSGVGKSSLIKALLPDREILIQALSEATGHGTHATTTATLYHMPAGGDLIDSPGVRSFELADLHPDDLERGFVELAPFAGHCRFSDCSHTVEPGCALRAAIERGELDARRLQSYQQIKSALRAG